MTFRLAIVGCGAITELGHLPGAARAEGVDVAVLVDRDEARARRLAAMFGVPHVATDIARAADHADGACVCLPPHLNRMAAEMLLGAGLHVLVEKPLATTAEDCAAIVAAAERAQRVLAVAMARRFTRAAGYLKALVASGMLGRIERYTARSGTAEAWPARSAFNFRVAESGGGTLMANGSHDLDMMTWLLGPLETFAFRSDSAARMEANALLTGRLQGGAEATVEVSRTRTLSNTIRIEGEHGVAIAPTMGETVTVVPRGCPARDLPPVEAPPLDYPGVMARQLEDFAAAARSGREALVGGASGHATVALIEACYARAEPLDFPFDVPVVLPEAA